MRSIHNACFFTSSLVPAVNHYVKIQFEINSQLTKKELKEEIAVNHYVKIQFEINSQPNHRLYLCFSFAVNHYVKIQFEINSQHHELSKIVNRCCKPLRKNTI